MQPSSGGLFFDRVEKSFGGTQALKGVSLKIERGEIVPSFAALMSMAPSPSRLTDPIWATDLSVIFSLTSGRMRSTISTTAPSK